MLQGISNVARPLVARAGCRPLTRVRIPLTARATFRLVPRAAFTQLPFKPLTKLSELVLSKGEGNRGPERRPRRRMEPSTVPLVWIDCEMTGLDREKDTIMSICCIITSADLQPIDPAGFDAVIWHSQASLDAMDRWCTRTHGTSGLTAACLASETSAEQAATDLLEYVQKHVPIARQGLLAGNTVHADKEFLGRGPYKKVLDHLSYRILDVSSIKEAAMRWASPGLLAKAPRKKMAHEARADILESIEEARFYKDVFFRDAPKLGWGS